MAAILASAIESTIDSRVCGCYATLSRRPPALNAPGRTTRNALGRMTTNDPERTTPNGTAPGRVKCAMPVVRNAKPALAWRYPRRAPVAKRITSPPAPGNAPAASAHSETGSRMSPKTCRKDDPAPIGLAASGASRAIPDTADARPSASASSGATPVAAPVTGRPEIPASGGPEIPASGRPSGNRDATDAPAAADRPGPWTPATSPTTGCAPRCPTEGKKVGGQLREQDTASATELSMS